MGITVSKKIGNAVCRNRAKRVLNEPQLCTGVDFVFVARSKTVDVNMRQVEKEMHIFFRKEALLKEKGGFDEKGGPLVN